MNRSLPSLSTTGDPSHQQLEANIRRALDQLHGQVGDAAAFASASGAIWASPEPASSQEALTRLAAAVAGLLGGPIP